MKLYKHHIQDKKCIWIEAPAWINRITTPYGYEGEKQEIWYVILPSWGYGYSINYDKERWGRRTFMTNLRTGENRRGWYFES